MEFGYEVKEKSLWEYKRRIFNEGMKNGTQPKQMAELLRRIGKRKLKENLKIFVTRKGNGKQLEYLLSIEALPIIHRGFHEEDGEGHYEVVLGIDRKTSSIYLYNSANNVKTSGFYRKSMDEFMRFWWPNPKLGGERWYLVAVERDEKLPSSRFRGKYL